jgi:hypothetical protein
VKNKNCVLLADSHNILRRWKNFFSQLLNVHNVSDVRQIEIIHTAEALLPDPRCFEVETAIAGLEKYKLIGIWFVILGFFWHPYLMTKACPGTGENVWSQIGRSLNGPTNRRKREAIPVTGLRELRGFETSRNTHFLDSRHTGRGYVSLTLKAWFNPQEKSCYPFPLGAESISVP